MPLEFCQGATWCLLLAALVLGVSTTGAENESVRVAVVAPPDGDHLAWAEATQLQHAAKAQGIGITVEQAALTGSVTPGSDLYVMPVRSLAMQLPAYQILELPFFYASLEAVHQRLDGALGKYLADESRKRGWEVLAYWDEGMHIFSGLKHYDRVRNLKAREFLITRPDPVAEKQFQYWKADARRIDPGDRQAVLRECVIASRSATLQEVLRERLYQVHFALSLTYHRYEGWVLVAPVDVWLRFDEATRQKLKTAVRETTAWQRNDAQRREGAALTELKKAGMTVYEVDEAGRDAFRRALPDWAELLPDELGAQKKRVLIELASPGAAAVAGPAGGPAATDARRDPAPATNAR
jgi:TRAP-type C4-dicarboxylate transport system substrate-binding protein